MSENLQASGLYCAQCGEVLQLPPGLCDEELKNAVTGFMVDHVDLHGGDPAKVPFSIRFEGNLVRATT